MIFRLAYVVWAFVFLALGLAALAETVFGEGPLGRRINNFLPRVVVALVWPLALFTPRGRYLLWRRWRQP